jgi:hypothetical protein
MILLRKSAPQKWSRTGSTFIVEQMLLYYAATPEGAHAKRSG